MEKHLSNQVEQITECPSIHPLFMTVPISNIKYVLVEKFIMCFCILPKGYVLSRLSKSLDLFEVNSSFIQFISQYM